MHKISYKEILAFVFFLSCFLFPGFGDTLLLTSGKNTTIIASLVGMLLGIIPISLILYILNINPSLNIFELNKQRFKFLGNILNFLLIISIIYIIVVGTWAIITFTVGQFLTRTSYYLVLIAMMFLVSLAVIKKLEVIGRTALVLLGLFLLISFFAFIFLVPLVEVDNFYPIFNISYPNFIKTALIFLSFGTAPLISLLAIRKSDIVNTKRFNIKIIISYLIVSIIVIIFLSLIIGIFGIEMSVLFTYPEYTLFKKINAFNFIQRIENIVSVIVFIASFKAFCNLFTFIICYIKDLFNIKSSKTLNIITICICFIIPVLSIYLLQNYPILYIFTEYPKISIGVFGILILNTFLLFITNKKVKIKH